MTTPLESKRLTLLAIAGLVLALGLPELGLPQLLFGGGPIGTRLGRELVWIAFGCLVIFWVLRVEKLPLASIGLKPPTRATVGWSLATTVALIASAMLSFALVGPALGLAQNTAATSSVVDVPLWLLLLTPLVAGVTEEIIYRGYAIERLTFLTARRWLGAVLAGSAFLLAHWSWGALQLIVVGFGTLIFTALYLWRRDLLCCMIAHILADLIGFALARAQM